MTDARTPGTITIGGDVVVNRRGFGAMRERVAEKQKNVAAASLRLDDDLAALD